MNTFKYTWFCILGFVCLGACEKKVVCYYSTWATYRPGNGQFNVEHIDVDLCTHVIYTFTGLSRTDGSIISLDPWLDLNSVDGGGRDNLRKFTALKKKNPNLKTLLAVGGWNEGSKSYSIMAASPTMRKTFVASSLEFLQKYNFDGLDFDWEYPNQRDTENGEADIDNFTQLVRELNEAFKKHGYSLSIAAAAVEQFASTSYDIPAISKYLDFVNIMSYDFYLAWDAVTGHNAQIFPGEGDENLPKDSLYTLENALKYWLDAGIPPEKLILGLPLNGHTFDLTNATNSSVRAPNSGPGIAGPFTRTPGSIGYNELCSLFGNGDWDIRFDELAKVPYAVRGRDWVSYDDSKSLAAKVEYGLSSGVGGFMIWSIETDDFHGFCTGTKNPLLKAVNDAIQKRKSGNF